MALIRRGDLNRPLTIEEMDGNFDYLESLSSGGATGPTGPAGATGPSGIGATPSLQQVTDVSYVTTTGILIDNPYGSSQYSTPYTGGSPQLRFFTSGDGLEFPDTNSMTMNMNIEEWYNLQAVDDAGFISSISVSPYIVNATYNGNDGFTSLTLNGSGVGIEGSIIFRGDIGLTTSIYQNDTVNGYLNTLHFDTDSPRFGLSSIGIDSSNITMTNGSMFIETTRESIVFSSAASVNGGKGISGGDDYSANITSLDYTQKSYVDSIRPYKVYTALLSQSGTNAPTEIILENSDDYFSLSWQRESAGNYFATSTASFTINKTAVFITPNVGGHHFAAYSPSVNEVWIEVTQTTAVGPYNAIGVDSILANTTIEIRVYP